jgi:hypothetical protein
MDLFSIAENLTSLDPVQLITKILGRAEIQKLIIELNTENQLEELNENAFSVKLVSIGGSYSPGYAASKGVPVNSIDLNNTGRYYKTFKVVPLSNGNAEITSDNTIHGSDTYLANERWGEVEGLNQKNTVIVLEAIDLVYAETLLQ